MNALDIFGSLNLAKEWADSLHCARYCGTTSTPIVTPARDISVCMRGVRWNLFNICRTVAVRFCHNFVEHVSSSECSIAVSCKPCHARFFWVLNMRSSVVACVLPQLHRVYVLRESFAFYHAGVERAIEGGCVCLATAAPRMYVR